MAAAMPPSIRTCIGCRRRAPARELVRLVAADGRLHAGPRGGRPGRGASIHPQEACVSAAVERRAFARALRMPVAPSPVPEHNGKNIDSLAMKAFASAIEVAYITQQPRSG